MLASARSLVKDKAAVFIDSERILHKADYSFASGIFNVKFDIEEGVWESYIKETLANMNDKSVRGFAFNILTTYVDYREQHLYYADPLSYFDYCKRSFSRNVSLLHDYNLYEWTIYVRK